jgi:hypothetical protein
VKRLVLTLALMALTACETTTTTATEGAVVKPEPTIGGVSAAALAALPAGVPPSALIRGKDGCYGVVVEVTTPLVGVPLRGPDGQQVCT